ncbi:hypothetical protein J4214_01125 [Candidatus Woesearchaeota archaeon]|nr:hypothetical protein [Candidatus Woesearchaeota archaeon]
MKKLFFNLFFVFFFLLAFLIPKAYAHCPLCSGAVAAAAISAKYYGFDPSVIGLFIGAFAVSTGLWFNSKLKNYFRFQKELIVLLSFLVTVVPVSLKVGDVFYVPLGFISRTLWPNKIVFGSFIGALTFFLASWLNKRIKLKLNRNIIPFQGILLNVFALIIVAALFYFIV